MTGKRTRGSLLLASLAVALAGCVSASAPPGAIDISSTAATEMPEPLTDAAAAAPVADAAAPTVVAAAPPPPAARPRVAARPVDPVAADVRAYGGTGVMVQLGETVTVPQILKSSAYRLADADLAYVYSGHAVELTKLADLSHVAADSSKDGRYAVRRAAGPDERRWSVKDAQVCFAGNGGSGYCSALFLYRKKLYVCSFGSGACDFVVSGLKPLS